MEGAAVPWLVIKSNSSGIKKNLLAIPSISCIFKTTKIFLEFYKNLGVINEKTANDIVTYIESVLL